MQKKVSTKKVAPRYYLSASRIWMGVLLTLAAGVFSQPALTKSSVQVESQIISEFKALAHYIVAQQALPIENRNTLQRKLKEAEAAFTAGQQCQAATRLSDFAGEAQRLRQGEQIAVAERLHNRGWQLRADVLLSLARERSCDDAAGFQQEPRVEKMASDSRHLQGRITFGEPLFQTIKQGDELFTKLLIPGVGSEIGETGAPAVARYSRLIAVPQGATARVNFTPGAVRTLKLNLHPFQIPRVDRLQRVGDGFQPEPPPPFIKNEEAYARNAFSPAPVCTVSPAGNARDLEFVRLTCATGQYNPVTDEMQLFASIDFDVQFQGGNGYFLTRKALSPFETTHAYIDIALNKEIITKNVKPDGSPSTCVGEEFLILTHPNFHSAAEELAKWKMDKGIMTSVFDVNNGSGNAGPDTQEEIDAFIESRFYNCQTRPSYVLLLGDIEYVPTFHVETTTSPNTGTDHPYSQLANNDQIGVPDFAVGRISVDTLDEANIVVTKSIKYEQHPPFKKSFYQKPLMATTFECCQMDVDMKGKDNMPRTKNVQDWSTRLEFGKPYQVDRFYVKTVEPDYQTLAGEGVARRYDTGAPLPGTLNEENGYVWKMGDDTQGFVNSINDGRFLVNYAGHGLASAWATPKFWRFLDDYMLNNGNLTPVIFSASCSTAMFDNEVANGEEWSGPDFPMLGEWFLLTNQGGAVGFFGGTRAVYTISAQTWMQGLFEAVWPSPYAEDPKPKYRLGDILVSSKLYLWEQQNMYPDKYYAPTDAFYHFNLLGDPTLEMWTSDPYDFTLNLDFEYKVFDQFLHINYSVEGATITAFQVGPKGSKLPIARGQVQNGAAKLSYVNRPIAGTPIQFAASMSNRVSVKLGK